MCWDVCVYNQIHQMEKTVQAVLDGKSSQEYPVNAGVSQGSILGPTLFWLYTNDLLGDVICDIAIYADDAILYSKCDQASVLWQQLELASHHETLDWGKKWLVDLNVGKNCDWPNNTGAIDVKMDGSVLEKKLSFKMLGLTFSSKLSWGSYIILKTLKKIYGPFLWIGCNCLKARATLRRQFTFYH